MVENKKSIYDDEGLERTPLLQARYVEPDADLLQGEVAVAEDGSPDASVSENALGTRQPEVVVRTEGVDEQARSTDDYDAFAEIKNGEEQHHKELVNGAGIASGVVGCFLGGPLLAVFLGFGAVYAYEREGLAGDTARAMGDLAIIVREKARKINSRHHVAEKTSEFASSAYEKAKEADRKHRIIAKARALTVDGFNAAVDFVQRHQLVERGVEAVGKAVHWASDAIETRTQRNEEFAAELTQN